MEHPSFTPGRGGTRIVCGSAEVRVAVGLSAGGAELLNWLTRTSGERKTVADVVRAIGKDRREPAVRGWFRDAAAFVAAVSALPDLPEALSPVLAAFEIRPAGGGGRPGEARYRRTDSRRGRSSRTPDHLLLRGTGIKLRYVPGGAYHRGRSDTSYTDERPAHPVRLSPFLLAEWPVTNGQYQRFLDEVTRELAQATPRSVSWWEKVRAVWREGERWTDDHGMPEELRWGQAPDDPPPDLAKRLAHQQWTHPRYRTSEHESLHERLVAEARAADAPVVGVDWLCVHAWLAWYNLALPTEGIWEFAALGAEPPESPGSGGAPLVPRVGASGGGMPSYLGFCGMVGTGWEWCADWYDLYAQDELTPAMWDPLGPTEPASRGGQRRLPYRCLRGGSWEGGEVTGSPWMRGGNYLQWRAIWDTFRPFTRLAYPFLAWQFGLPVGLEEEAVRLRETLLRALHPEASSDGRRPEVMRVGSVKRRQEAFLDAVRRHRARVERDGVSLQASVVTLEWEVRVHEVHADDARDIEGLPQVLAGVTSGAQAGPVGGFSWVDCLDLRGDRLTRPRLSHCAWSRVPGMDAWLLVESHSDLDPEKFPREHEVFGWLRRAGWDDRRWATIPA